MKIHLFLSVISLLSFNIAWGADIERGFVSETQGVSSSVHNEQAIQELFSKKFNYFGSKLNDEIQRIREKRSFQELNFIERSLTKLSQDADSTEKKEDKEKVEITLFVKKGADDNDFKKALLAAAYFPEELDPKTKSFPLVSLASFKCIHRQLADSFFYGHPLAGKYLRDIANICNVPLEESSDFYRNFYNLPDSDVSEYNQYLIKITLSSDKGDTEVGQVSIKEKEHEDINEKVNFPSYSKETLTYFQELLSQEQSPEKRNKRRKTL